MKKIYIAVGSLRRPKLNAVWEAVSVFGPTLDHNAQFEVVGVEVPSGVGHTPLSRAEVMAGARQRALELVRIARQRGEPWSYFVGLEGGLDVVPDPMPSAAFPLVDQAKTRRADDASSNAPPGTENSARKRMVFLVSWAYVTDGAGRGYYGQAGGIPLPEELASRVVDAGAELSEAIDAFAGKQGVREAQGAWGILTSNLITRQDVFRTAVINAFAPFFNVALYRKS